MSCHSLSSLSDPRLVGDPVDTLTGAVYDQKLDFRLTGPLELRWYRHYSSSQSHRRYLLGWGHSHEFDRSLRSHGAWFTYEAPVGISIDFPALTADGQKISQQGFTLHRVHGRCYRLHRHGEPSMEFEFRSSDQPARLGRLVDGSHEVRFEYDSSNRMERIVDSLGRVVDVAERDGLLHRLSLRRPSSTSDLLLLAYEYDAAGNLVRTVNAAGHGHSFTYDVASRLVSVSGRKGFRFRYVYDSLGRCKASVADDRLYGVALNYKIPGRLTEVTRADLGVWSYEFDAAGQLQQIRDPLGGRQLFVRDGGGRIAFEVDPNGNVTWIDYDKAGAAIARIDPLGYRVTLPEDPNAADPLEERVAANPAEYEYGRLLDASRIVLPTHQQMQSLPVPADVRAAVLHTERSAQIPSEFQVRPLGALWWPLPASGRSFNELGKLVKQVDEFGRLRHWEYDASGNLAGYRDFDGREWTYDYGTWHLLRQVTNPMGSAVKVSYTTNGEVASHCDAGGTLSQYAYDLKDQLIEVRRGGVVRDCYTRDAVGNLVAKHGADGRELLRFEIGAGNLRTKRILASGDEHSFAYDKVGRYLEVATKNDVARFAYDPWGNCALETRNGKGLVQRYGGWRQPEESLFMDRFAVRYRREGNDTVVVTDPAGLAHRLRFLKHGLVERRYGNGSREWAQYNVSGRCLLRIVHRKDRAAWNRFYHWSGEGELLQIDDSIAGSTRHEYDPAHRLTRRHSGGKSEEYRWDAADNLLAKPGLANLLLGTCNRLNEVDGFALTYNDRGHIETRQLPTGTVRYAYDSRDLLTRIESGQGTWEARYDGLGRRTRKTWAQGQVEYYWNGNQLFAEVAEDGRLRIYVYADSLSLTPFLFLDYDSVDSPATSGKRYFVFVDQVAAPCLIENDAGVEVWRAKMEPFGYAHVEPGSAIEFSPRFPGHYFDAETGLNYNRFRYYDPRLGRYLQSDPWGVAGGANVYVYRSNPLLDVDVRGLGEEGDKRCKSPEEDEEGTAKPGQSKGEEDSKPKPLKDMTDEELRAHVDERANALKAAFAEGDPEGEKSTTLSVGVVQKGDDPETRKVVVTTSDDSQKLDPSVQKAMLPGEEGRATEPTLGRGPRYDNPDYVPPPEGPIDSRNNPKTKTDPVIIDPETGEQKPYTKATNGDPVEGTQHHAEQRMETGAADNGEKVLAQQPTKPCCPGCKKVLGDNGLSKIPNP